MQTQTKQPTAIPFIDRAAKHQHFTSVNVTFDYGMFKMMQDNRQVNEMHLKRLIASFKNKHLISPIIVNEKMEIIDGQHRLLAAKQVQVPVYYIIIKNYGINEVAILNTNQKNWTKMDYLNMYAEEGRPAYKQLREFMSAFPDFGIQVAERICTLKQRSKMTEVERVAMKDFEEGKLFIPDIEKSYKIARKVMEFQPFYDGFNRGTFVSALLPLMSHKVYNHKEMIHKLSGPIKLEDCANVPAYRELLENIYNYKRQKDNKVSFRYLN